MLRRNFFQSLGGVLAARCSSGAAAKTKAVKSLEKPLKVFIRVQPVCRYCGRNMFLEFGTVPPSRDPYWSTAVCRYEHCLEKGKEIGLPLVRLDVENLEDALSLRRRRTVPDLTGASYVFIKTVRS